MDSLNGYSKEMAVVMQILDHSDRDYVLIVRNSDDDLSGEWSSSFHRKDAVAGREEDIYYITFLIQILINRFGIKHIDDIERFKLYFNQVCTEAVDQVIKITNMEEE